MAKAPITETVVLNGRRFPRYLTSPRRGGWYVVDMTDRSYLEAVYPNKRMALKAAHALNRGTPA